MSNLPSFFANLANPWAHSISFFPFSSVVESLFGTTAFAAGAAGVAKAGKDGVVAAAGLGAVDPKLKEGFVADDAAGAVDPKEKPPKGFPLEAAGGAVSDTEAKTLLLLGVAPVEGVDGLIALNLLCAHRFRQRNKEDGENVFREIF